MKRPMVKYGNSTFSKAYNNDNDFMLARKAGTAPVKLLFDRSLWLHAQKIKVTIHIVNENHFWIN